MLGLAVILGLGTTAYVKSQAAPAPAPAPTRAPAVSESDNSSGQFPADVGRRAASSIQKLKLPNMTPDKVAALEKELRDFVAAKAPADLSDERRRAIIRNLDRHAAELFRARPDGGDEAARYGEAVTSLEWTLYMAMRQRDLPPDQFQAREVQRDWMRAHLMGLNDRPGLSRLQATAQLEQLFADPLSVVFHEPLAEDQFASFTQQILAYPDQNIGYALPHFVRHILQLRYRNPERSEATWPFAEPVSGFGHVNTQIRVSRGATAAAPESSTTTMSIAETTATTAAAGPVIAPAAAEVDRARLQFRLVTTDTAVAADEVANPFDRTGAAPKLRVLREVVLNESAVDSARVTTSPQAAPQVAIRFNAGGAARFAEITGANTGQRLAILFDGKLLSTPVIRSRISGGQAVISGNYTREQAQALASAISEAAKAWQASQAALQPAGAAPQLTEAAMTSTTAPDVLAARPAGAFQPPLTASTASTSSIESTPSTTTVAAAAQPQVVRLNAGKLSLEVMVVDRRGQRAPSDVTLWKPLRPGESAPPATVIWEPVEAAADLARADANRKWIPAGGARNAALVFFEGLAPGEYRVAAARNAADPTPIGASPIIRLDGAKSKLEVTIRLAGDAALLVETIDAVTSQPIGNASLLVRRFDGLPLGVESGAFRVATSADGSLRLGGLVPGRYYIEAQKAAAPGQPAYSTAPPGTNESVFYFEVERGQANALAVPMYAAGPLSAAQPSTSSILSTSSTLSTPPQPNKPYTVSGAVNDAEGDPMAGVTVRVAAGTGTLLPVGLTTTTADGRYTMPFGPGAGVSGSVPQAAIVTAHKAGYFEQNLSRQGNLAIAASMPDAYRGAPLILPGQSQAVDFVLRPAATIHGRLVDSTGVPMPAREVQLNGKQLPPAQSVLATANTGAGGRFEFNDVPLETWWFALRDGRASGPRSDTIDIAQPMLYEVELTYERPLAGQPILTVRRTEGETTATEPLEPGAATPSTSTLSTSSTVSTSSIGAAPQTAAAGWGRPTKGLQAVIAFESGERPYKIGEVVSFLFTLRNATSNTIRLVYNKPPFLGWAPAVIDAQGGKAAVLGPVYNIPVERATLTIGPGRTVVLGSPSLEIRQPGWTGDIRQATLFARPGRYRVSQTYRFQSSEPGFWSGEVKSGELELTITSGESAEALPHGRASALEGGEPAGTAAVAPETPPTPPPGNGALSGRVIDSTGIGIAGAKIEFARLEEESPDSPSRRRILGASATDDTGRFTFDGATSGNVRMTIAAAGFATRRDEKIDRLLAGGETATIALLRSCQVRGRVFDMQGQPLAKAPVSLSVHVPYPDGECHGPNAFRAVTNERGEFVFENVPPGRHLAIYPWLGPEGRERPVVAPILGRCAIAIVELAEGQLAPEVVLDLTPSKCTLAGKVTDEDGNAVEDAEVRIMAPLADDMACSVHGPDYPVGRTSPDGTYRLDGLPAGEWLVEAASPQHGRSRPAKMTLTVGPSAACNLTLAN
jgi:protocatechuate 3,4-dioxygenase beta subunit